MTAQTDFWLALHQLAEAYKSTAEMQEERIQRILVEFYQKSPAARQELKAEFLSLLIALEHLYPRMPANESQ